MEGKNTESVGKPGKGNAVISQSKLTKWNL